MGLRLQADSASCTRPDNYGIFRRSGYYIDKILREPADLPVEQPTKFEFIINRKTADALGLTVSRTMLVAADDILQ
jgi:putative ABC transport system substrate-binding protein